MLKLSSKIKHSIWLAPVKLCKLHDPSLPLAAHKLLQILMQVKIVKKDLCLGLLTSKPYSNRQYMCASGNHQTHILFSPFVVGNVGVFEVGRKTERERKLE